MRLILDTHILLWTLADSRALPSRGKDLLLDPGNEKVASVVSLWEIAIKFPLGRGGRGDLPFGAARAAMLIGEVGLGLLSVTPDHAVAVEALGRGGHGDPFDRMLVAQALAERMILLTSDAALAGYGDTVLLV